MGTDTARRQLAVQLGIDPYTDFQPLAQRLEAIAKASALGGFLQGPAYGRPRHRSSYCLVHLDGQFDPEHIARKDLISDPSAGQSDATTAECVCRKFNASH